MVESKTLFMEISGRILWKLYLYLFYYTRKHWPRVLVLPSCAVRVVQVGLNFDAPVLHQSREVSRHVRIVRRVLSPEGLHSGVNVGVGARELQARLEALHALRT